MSSLGELVKLQAEIEAQILEQGGELTPNLEIALDGIHTQLLEKADSYAFVLERLEKSREYLDTQEKKWSRAKRAIEGSLDYLKGKLKGYLSQAHIPLLNGEQFTLKATPTRASLQVDEGLLPSEYLVQHIEWKVDKERLRLDLEQGKEIPGARLVKSFALRIGVKK